MFKGGIVLGLGVTHSTGKLDLFTANRSAVRSVASHVVQTVNGKERESKAAFSPASAPARGVAVNYQFDAKQVAALVPIYRWHYHADPWAVCISLHDRMHSQYGWIRSSPHPEGYVYSRPVKDSRPVVRYHGAPARQGMLWFPGYAYNTNPHGAGRSEGVVFWEPTAGPFTQLAVERPGFSYSTGRINAFI